MGSVASSLGLGSQFTYKEKTYTLSPWDFSIQANFERYIEDKAVQAARRMQRHLPEKDYSELLAKVTRDIATGVYSFGGEVISESLKSVENLQHLVFLMLKKNHPEVTPQLVKEIFKEEMDLVLQKMNEANADPDALPKPGEEGQDPNAPAGPAPGPG